METILSLTDDELRLVVKSLSITYDSLSSKLQRVKSGRLHEEATGEFTLCDRVLTKARQAQTARITGHPTERTA